MASVFVSVITVAPYLLVPLDTMKHGAGRLKEYVDQACHSSVIINVSRTLILGLPPKQNGHPIGYITLRTLISQPKRTVSHL